MCICVLIDMHWHVDLIPSWLDKTVNYDVVFSSSTLDIGKE